MNDSSFLAEVEDVGSAVLATRDEEAIVSREVYTHDWCRRYLQIKLLFRALEIFRELEDPYNVVFATRRQQRVVETYR